MKVKGHKLEIEKATEKKRIERTHTGRCVCGWEEGCSTLSEIRKEYSLHLKRAKGIDLDNDPMIVRGSNLNEENKP